jgi:hypothetical protein
MAGATGTAEDTRKLIHLDPGFVAIRIHHVSSGEKHIIRTLSLQ